MGHGIAEGGYCSIYSGCGRRPSRQVAAGRAHACMLGDMRCAVLAVDGSTQRAPVRTIEIRL